MKNFISNYKVYEDGRVQRIMPGKNGAPNSIVGKFLKQEVMKDGYRRVTLCNAGITRRISVHRLVALVHLPNPNNLPIINHKNGDKADNRLENLEWCDYSHNNKHAYDVLNKDPMYGEARYNSKLTSEIVVELRKMKDPDFKSLAIKYGCSPSTIADAYIGRTWPHV